MDILAVAVLGFFAIGYLVLGGADIGTGMMLPFLGRSDRERRLVVAAIAPFFLGNEVWLVATVGLLAGAFPILETRLLHALYPAVLAVALAWVIRDMGLWLRGRVDAGAWRLICDGAIVTGSWALALSWGAILADLLGGAAAPVLAGPVTALGALAIAALFAAHGLTFATLRLSGQLRERARLLSRRTGEARAFTLTAAAMAVLGLVAGIRLAPAEAAADPATLALLVPTVLVVTPVLVASQAWVWRLFRHRVTAPSYL